MSPAVIYFLLPFAFVYLSRRDKRVVYENGLFVDNMKPLKVISLIGEPPLAPLWKDAKLEVPRNLEHLQLPQRSGVWFYMEKCGKNLFCFPPMLLVYSLLHCLVFSRNTPFLIPWVYQTVIFQRGEDINKTLILGISWVIMVNEPARVLNSGMGVCRTLRCSWCMQENMCVVFLTLRYCLAFGRPLHGQPSEYLHFICVSVCCWLW